MIDPSPMPATSDGGPDWLEVHPMDVEPVLDDLAWHYLPSQRLVDSFTGNRPRWPTFVTAASSANYLWVHFRNEADRVRATLSNYKDKVWHEDAVEVYVTRVGVPLLYEFQLNPIGTVRDLVVHDPGEPCQQFDDSWSCSRIVTGAAVDKSADGSVYQWRALIGIPWTDVDASINDPDVRIGVFRIERDPEEFSALRWASRKEADLHDPRLLACVRYVGDSDDSPNAQGIATTTSH